MYWRSRSEANDQGHNLSLCMPENKHVYMRLNVMVTVYVYVCMPNWVFIIGRVKVKVKVDVCVHAIDVCLITTGPLYFKGL